MKKNIIFAVALTIATTFGFTSCNKSAPKMDEKSETTSQKAASTEIAYVEVDSIMTQYTFAKEYSQLLEKKARTSRPPSPRRPAAAGCCCQFPAEDTAERIHTRAG